MNSTTPPALLVLAAGMGSRYGGLKQIDPVGPGGETIMDYSIYDAVRAGFGKIVFVTRRDIEGPFRRTIGARFEKRIHVDYAFQELDQLPPGLQVPAGRTRPWGTAHAVLAAADKLHEPFGVINADDFYGAGSYCALARFLKSDSPDYSMVGFVLRNTLSDFGAVARGICAVNDQGFLQGVVERTNIRCDRARARITDGVGTRSALTGDEVVSMNMWGFTPQILGELQDFFQAFLKSNRSNLQAECYLPSAVNEFVTCGQAKVRVLRSSDSWFGVTYREDRSRVIENIGSLIRTGSYPERLWA